jgi:hypothetical protein
MKKINGFKLLSNLSTYWEKGNDKVFFTKDSKNDYLSILDTFLSKGNGTIGKNIYLGKGSNIPRHKMKIFIEENNIKKTSIIEKSDTVIFDKKEIKKIRKWVGDSGETEVAFIPFSKEMLLYVLDFHNNQKGWRVDKEVKNFKEYYSKEKTCIISEKEYYKFSPELRKIIGNVNFETLYELDTYRTRNLLDVKDTLDYYFTNPHGNVIWDDEILEKLNSNGIELDQEYLNTLEGMFESRENDNITLAFEMLSNVNLEKDSLKIALLLNKHRDKFNWGKGNTSSQAFKILDKYFLNKGIDWRKDYRFFGAGLYKNYINNPESKELIEKFMLEHINQHLAQNGSNILIQIKDFNISLCERVK